MHIPPEVIIARMTAGDLVIRADPTDPRSCILTRRHGSMTLGAGRARRADVEALAADGRLAGSAGAGWRLARPGAPAAGGVGVGHDPSRDRTAARAAEACAVPAVNPRESPLLWLARRKGPDGKPLLDAAQVKAGERLRADATLAAMLPSVTANWGRLEEAGGAPAVRDPAMASDRVIAARQRVRAAHRQLGPGLGNLLLDVCVFLTPLQEAERRRGWPARAGKVALELGLTRLAEHYGLQSEAEGPDRAAMRAWAADDARAGIQAWLVHGT